jgi:nitrate/nitrite transporter NarK
MAPNRSPDERSPLLAESRSEIVSHIPPSGWLGPVPDGEATEDENVVPSNTNSHYLGNYTKSQFWFLYTPILFQYFVATFDSTLMASSHPVITSYFHSSNSASWLSTAFMLTSTAFQPLFGRVSDMIGRKPMYLFSLVMFAVTTTWCALAQSMGSFIAARAFCGLGAGGVMAMVT